MLQAIPYMNVMRGEDAYDTPTNIFSAHSLTNQAHGALCFSLSADVAKV